MSVAPVGIRRFLDVLYPRHCTSCDARLSEEAENGLCWDCRSEVHPLGPPWCERCGVSVAGRIDHCFTCSDCREHPPAYDKGRSLYHYEGGIREAIHALKYQRDFSVIPDLSRILFAGLRAHLIPEGEVWLCPVPLHARKHRSRGFNQSEELARFLSRHHKGFRIWRGVRRIKATESQTRLSKAGRRENVRGAFSPRSNPGVVPEQIVLVDDVMTTGATLNAVAKSCRQAGVQRIFALTVARG